MDLSRLFVEGNPIPINETTGVDTVKIELDKHAEILKDNGLKVNYSLYSQWTDISRRVFETYFAFETLKNLNLKEFQTNTHPYTQAIAHIRKQYKKVLESAKRQNPYMHKGEYYTDYFNRVPSALSFIAEATDCQNIAKANDCFSKEMEEDGLNFIQTFYEIRLIDSFNSYLKKSYIKPHIPEGMPTSRILHNVYDSSGDCFYDSIHRGRDERHFTGPEDIEYVGIVTNEPTHQLKELQQKLQNRTQASSKFNSRPNPSARWVQRLHNTRVHTFVNSISGFLLMHTRVLISLYEKILPSDNQFEFSQEQFIYTFRNLITMMVVISGGHSFFEGFDVLKEKTIARALSPFLYPDETPKKAYALFNELGFYDFFVGNNEQALRSSLEKTIDYNEKLIAYRKNLMCPALNSDYQISIIKRPPEKPRDIAKHLDIDTKVRSSLASATQQLLIDPPPLVTDEKGNEDAEEGPITVKNTPTTLTVGHTPIQTQGRSTFFGDSTLIQSKTVKHVYGEKSDEFRVKNRFIQVAYV